MKSVPVSMSLIAALFLALLSWPNMARAENQELVISRMDNGDSSRITSLVLGMIYDRVGRSVRFQEYPNKMALEIAVKGEVDGTSMRIAGLQEKHPHLRMVPTPHVDLKFRIFARKPVPEFVGLDDLKDLRIGIVEGVLVSERMTKGMNVTAYKTVNSLFLALMVDNVDIALATDLIGGLEIIRNFSQSGIRASEPPIRIIQLHHYLHERHADLIAPLDAEIKKLRESGELDLFYGEAFKQVK